MNRDGGFEGGGLDERFIRRGVGEGEDRRYLRRRANRRVRKARITRNVARWALILALQLAFGALVTVVGYRAWVRIAASDEFALKRIEFAGARRVKPDTIESALEPYLGGAVFGLDLNVIERAVERDPWVRTASLRRVLPDTLRIEITERTPAAIAVIGGLAHVVDGEGFVIGPTGLHPTDDLPVLTGLPPADHPGLSETLRQGVALLARLRRTTPGFVDEISELDLSRRDRITLRTVAPGPLLLLDAERIERNLSRFLDVRPVMQEQLEAADFVDLRWQDRVTVMPGEPVPVAEVEG